MSAANPPAVLIRIALEEPLKVYGDYGTDGEHARFIDWVETHPALRDLLQRARDLEQKARAA